MRWMLPFLLSLLLIPTAFASNHEGISVRVDAVQEDIDFGNTPVFYTIRDVNSGEEVVRSRDVTNDEGVLQFGLDPGLYQMEIGVDYEGTQGFDYFGESLLTVGNQSAGLTVGVQPVGSLSVSLVDAEGIPVNSGTLRVECEESYGEQGVQDVDEFGSVRLDYLPVGMCTLHGNAGGYFIDVQEEIEPGTRQNVTLRFTELETENDIPWLSVSFVLLVILGAGFGYLFFEWRGRTIEILENGSASEEDAGLSDVQRGILMGLGSRERKVLEFLYDNDVMDEGITQANLSRGTGIPKTSLARILDKLEGRDLIKVEKVGRSKKIRLSDRFLSQ